MKILGSLPYHCFLKFAGISRIPSLFQIVLTFNVDGLLAFVLLGVGPLYVAVVFFGCTEVLLGGVVLLVLGCIVVLLVLGCVAVLLVLGCVVVILVLGGVAVLLVLGGVAVLLILAGVVVFLVLGVVVVLVLGGAEVLFSVNVVLVTDRAAIHTDKMMAILEGKTLNTASMAIFSTAVKSALTVDPSMIQAAGGCL